MTEDEFEHFIEAQEAVYGEIVVELTAGQKRTHWMWFIFPQLHGLGLSPMARKFALASLDQARRYAHHAKLGSRLRQCVQLVLQVKGRRLAEIFGFPDDLKFHSSMTLFALAVPEEPLFEAALTKHFDGQKDAKTIALLGANPGSASS